MKLLVALDDSEPGWTALEFACTEHATDGITVVHAIDLTDSGYGEFAHVGTDQMLDRRQTAATAMFERAREHASEHGCSIETEIVRGQPAEAIVDYATQHPIDRIVVGSHGRTGVSRILLGSVAEQIARRAPVSVTIVR